MTMQENVPLPATSLSQAIVPVHKILMTENAAEFVRKHLGPKDRSAFRKALEEGIRADHCGSLKKANFRQFHLRKLRVGPIRAACIFRGDEVRIEFMGQRDSVYSTDYRPRDWSESIPAWKVFAELNEHRNTNDDSSDSTIHTNETTPGLESVVATPPRCRHADTLTSVLEQFCQDAVQGEIWSIKEMLEERFDLQLQKCNAELDDLQSLRKRFAQDLAATQHQSDDLQQRVEHVENSLNRLPPYLTQQLDELRRGFASLDERQKNVNVTADRLANSLQSLQQHFEEQWQRANVSLTALQNALLQSEHATTAAFADWQARGEAVERRVGHQTAVCSQVQLELDVLRDTVQAQQRNDLTAATTQRELRQGLQVLQQTIQELQQSFTENVSDLQTQVHELRKASHSTWSKIVIRVRALYRMLASRVRDGGLALRRSAALQRLKGFLRGAFLMVVLGLAARATPATAAPTTATRASEARLAIVVDVSGSVQGTLLEHEKAAVNVALTILEGTVWLVRFSDDAHMSPTMHLHQDADRLAAMRAVEGWTAGGNTNVVGALKQLATLPAGTPILLLTDGKPTNPTEEVLAACRETPGPITTISVAQDAGPDELLKEMSARTGGYFVKVADAQRLVETILTVTSGLTHYRSYTPTESELAFAGVRGRMIAIGLNEFVEILPSIASTPDFQYHAKLPVEDVALVARTVTTPTDVTIRAGKRLGPRARLGRVLLYGLSTVNVHLSGRTIVAGTLRVTTEFVGDDRNRIDPVHVPGLMADVILRDLQGRTLARRQAVPAAGALATELNLPRQPGNYELVVRSTDRRLGRPFEHEYRRTLRVIQPRFLGLDVERSAVTQDLGQVAAGQGDYSCRPVQAFGLDATGTSWQVRAEPLAGPGGIIPVKLLTQEIQPTRSTPGSITIKATVSDIAPGEYRGSIVLVPPTEEALELVTIPVALRVLEPLAASAVDAGEIAPGQTLTLAVPVENLGGAWNLSIEGSRIDCGQGIAIVEAPATARVSGANSKIPVRLSSSPLASAGEYQANLRFTRPGGIEQSVPIRFRIVPPAASLILRPENISLRASPGELKTFEVRLTNAQQYVIDIQAGATRFRDSNQRETGGVVSLAKKPLSIPPRGTKGLSGQLLAPDARGVHVAIVRLSTLTGDHVDLRVEVVVP